MTGFRKVSRGPDVLDCEREGLEALAAVGKVGVVKVLEYGRDATGEWLVLEGLLHPDRRLDYRTFGRQYAEHLLVRVGETFGWDRPNYIGLNLQINTPHHDWWEFWADRRLGFQTKMARDRGLIDAHLAASLDRIASRLHQRWGGLEVWPSLLHGDLWAGNHMMREDGTGVLIDPAVYRGHWEADLAMTRLFGGYPEAFYQGFHEILPRQPGHQEREVLYNLYHLLNHLNLFGTAYLGQVKASVRALG